MCESVISDSVSRFDNLACNVGALLYVATDQKKSCMHAIPGKNIQQVQSVGIVGTVIIGERDLLAAARQAGERWAEHLPRRRHRLIPRSNRGDRGGSSQFNEEHAGILKDCRLKAADFRFLDSQIDSSVFNLQSKICNLKLSFCC